MKNSYLKVDDKYSQTIVVGDIHGCFDELARLLELVGFCKNDVLISVGDMLDRGPKSWKVCEFFRDTPNAYSVLGNHERRLAGTIRGTSLPAWSQKHSLSALNSEDKLVWAEYLESLPAVIETEHAIVTHARLDTEKSLQQQDAYFTCAVGGSKVHIPLDENGVPLWFYKTDFRKAVCIGHVGYSKVELVAGKFFALDTGAISGGELTCVVFPSGKIFSVKSKRDYYTDSFNQWRMKMEEAEKNPYEWPLKKVIDLLDIGKNNDNLATTEQSAKAQLAVEELRIDEWNQVAQKELLKHFGNVPEPGPERGKYFKKVSGCFTNHQMGTLATKVMAGKLRRIDDFIPFVKKATLARVKHTMDEFLNIVKGSVAS